MTSFALLSVLALPPVMPVDSIEAGQKGTCLTVFEGTEVEPFDFVVKGVMKGFLGPGRDVVLIRLVGDKPEFTGVVAGMSGSPCSIDGKLVGALAYAFAAFAKEPIAGITPMNDMLEVLEQPDQARPWRIDAGSVSSKSAWDTLGAAGPTAVAKDSTSDAAWEALRRGDALASAPARSDGLQPISTPLSMGGLVPRVRDHFTPWLSSLGFMPVAGGVGQAAATAKDPGPLRPGSAVAALLVTGDVNIAATGTVTAVEGDAVLAFGHPFLGTGILSVPMARSTILNTMSSMQRSFKMSEVGDIVGEVTEDRLTAIGGYLGRKPVMIDVQGSVKAPAGTNTFAFQVARDASLSPRFVAMGLANALYGDVAASGRGTLRVTGTVAAEGLEPVVVRNVNAAARDPNLLLYGAIDIARTLSTLWDTPFGPPPDLNIRLDAELEPEPIVEWIEALHLDREVVHPGEPVDVAVRIRREDGPVRFERFSLSIPLSWAGESVDIIACSGSLAEQVAGEVGGDPRPADLRDIGKWLNGRRPDGAIYLLAVREGAGLTSRVDSAPFVPGSMVTVLSGDATTQLTARGLAWEERRQQPGALLGGIRTGVRVLPRRY